jgi:hypothetical protein
MTILLADDQPAALRGLQVVLAHLDHPFEVAHSAVGVLYSAAAHHASSLPPEAPPSIQTVKNLRLEWTGPAANLRGCVIQQAKVFTG